jgi:hypothetical protein
VIAGLYGFIVSSGASPELWQPIPHQFGVFRDVHDRVRVMSTGNGLLSIRGGSPGHRRWGASTAPVVAAALLAAVFAIGCAQALSVDGGAARCALGLRARTAAPRPPLPVALALTGDPLRQCSHQLHLRGGDDGDEEEGGGGDAEDAAGEAGGEEEGGGEEDAAGGDEEGGAEDPDAGPMTITKAIKQVQQGPDAARALATVRRAHSSHCFLEEVRNRGACE